MAGDMQQLTANKVVTVRQGRVRLSDEQARRRAHCIEQVEGSEELYRILSPIQIKAGESVELDEVDKLSRSSFDAAEVPEQAKANKPASKKSEG